MYIPSSDISSLAVRVDWNLSGVAPAINLTNLSTGGNLAGCSWAFVAYSPSLTPIHLGDINSPDVTGAWTTFTLNDTWPSNPFNQYQVEWGTYQFYVVVKDSNGDVYSHPAQQVYIAPPSGIGNTWQSFYGMAASSVTPKCNEGYVFFQDATDRNYQGNLGTKLTSHLIVSYPLDKTGNRQADFSLVAYASALVPVTINSPSYSFVQNTAYDYDFGNNTHVIINYFFQGNFGIWCGVDLLPLTAVINKFFAKIETNEFPDMSSAYKRGILILAEYSLVVTGILQPLAGATDIPYHIMRIEQLTGFKCFDACCNAQSGIAPTIVNSVIGGYNFIVNSLGGDVDGNFSVNGNNITLNIGDMKYIVDVTENSPSDLTALKVTPQLSGSYTKYYHLTLDGVTLANELASVIQNNVDVYNLWKGLFGSSSSSLKVAIDGACIFTSSNACDFTFGLSNIPATTTFALLKGIVIGAINTPLSFAFNLTNLPALQTYLNGKGLGTFVVTNGGGGVVTITSSANTNNITALNYSIANVIYTASLTRVCTGYVEREAQAVLQDIVYAFCALKDTGVATSENYQICYLDANGVSQTTTVSAGVNLSVFIAALLQAGCTTVAYLKNSGGGANCTNMTALFQKSTKTIDANTLIYGNKQGCAGMTPLELFQFMLKQTDSVTKKLFCDYVASCGAGLSCENVTFDVLVTAHDTACSNIVGMQYILS